MLECGDYNVLLRTAQPPHCGIASNNDVAIDLLPTDVITSDEQRPDLTKRMVALRPEMKVLFMSGYADSDVVRIKVLDPNLDFLPKPFTSDGLLETVDRALNAPGSRILAAALNMLSQAS
jgi:two-component system cell cycle sensor histidine kinase/response regulator CckA